eukprot:9903325-Lingulodinium_polyedra.AAC.1
MHVFLWPLYVLATVWLQPPQGRWPGGVMGPKAWTVWQGRGGGTKGMDGGALVEPRRAIVDGLAG